MAASTENARDMGVRGSSAVRAAAARILVIDDAPANLFAFGEVLKPLCEELIVTASGQEALELVAKQEFAVVLLDMMMPDMDGLETLSRMRATELIGSTPVIMITAAELTREAVSRAYALGAIDFITKPVYPEVLRGKVTSCMSLQLANQELRRREADLQMKDRQIAMLAHDLRNPLETISAGARLLGRLGESEKARRDQILARMARGARRMDSMIRDLLDCARVGSGAIPVAREQMDLGDLARELMEEFVIADPERRIQLTTAGRINGAWDRARLYQALSNLVGNATRYGRGTASISIAGGDSTVEVSVHNDGPPIPADLLPVIFEPFRRGAGNEDAGLGLGLYIVRAIAQAHGGEVSVASSSEEGTTFRLRLPSEPVLK
jgi:two-component system, sensor histidine kinase and response regulator